MKVAQLTHTQQYWRKHVIAALQSSSTLQCYANQQGIKVQTLYDWKYRLTKIGALDNEQPAPIAFQKVQITSSDCSNCTINLPNGITVEWPTGVAPAALCLMLAEIMKLS